MPLPSPSERPTLFLTPSQLGWFPFLPSRAHQQLCRGAARAVPAACAVRTDVHPALPGHPTLPALLRHLSMLTGAAPPSCPATYRLVVTKAARHKQQSHPCTLFAAFPPCRL